MLVRIEKLKNPLFVLVIDELEVYKGTVQLGIFHKLCLLNKSTVEIDEYTYYHADKEKINKYCKK